jgi:hypothetical protein
VLRQMPPDPSSELALMQLADLLIVYRTWRGRFVRNQPRQVHVSAELQAAALGQHQAAFGHIVKAIERGDDLTPHLSRRVGTAYVPTAVAQKQKKHQQSDRDLLIADWGIHHLHLSPHVKTDGFVTRTDDLLFAYFAQTDAYLINIYGHGSWALKEMIDICVHNWPDAGILTCIEGVTGLSQQFSEADRLPLRNAGVAQLLEIDGKVYMPAGQTTAGTPLGGTLAANNIHWQLRSLRDQPDLEALLDQQAHVDSSEPWNAHVDDDEFGFRRGDFFISLGRLS